MGKSIFCACLLLAAPAAAGVTSKFNLDIYGFIKTDFIYSDHGTGTNEYRIYTTSGRKDRALRSSARSSRFGFNISSGTAVSAKLEADFLGLTDSLAGTAGSTADLRLRQAYVSLKTGKAEILAGQAFYLITADLPDVLNDYYLGNSGVLWSRAPQLRASYLTDGKLRLAAAVVRPTAKLTDAEGTHSALPGVQGKIEQELGKARVSLAGAAGVWKGTSTQKTADISAVVAAFSVPWSRFTASGEVWTGRNLYDFLGGLGNLGYGAQAVPSKGGVLALKYKPAEDLWFNAAYGVDDPKNSKVAARGKTRNATALVNAVVRLYGCVEAGLEASELRTDYKGLQDRTSMNYQLSVKLTF